DGGALLVLGADLAIRNSLFSNHKGGTGGAVFAASHYTSPSIHHVEIVASQFENNLGYKRGGGLAVRGVELLVENSTFAGNTTYAQGAGPNDYGGAGIYSEGS